MGRRQMEKPWQIIAADIAGPFPRSPRGHEYILVFVDLFTRWVECIPLRKATAKNIIREFHDQIVTRYGAPEVFLSDNGTEFKNRVVEEYLSRSGISRGLTPIYCPRANPTERYNRTLKTMIRSYLEEQHKNWDEKLRDLCFALNTAVHSSTKVSPAILNYGRQPVPPATIRREREALGAENEENRSREGWADHLSHLPELFETVTERGRQEQERQAKIFDQKRRQVPFKVDDWVWYRNRVLSSAAKGISASLAPSYKGPYVIVEKLGANTFRIANHQETIEGTVHAEDLKLFHEATKEEEDEDTRPPRDIEAKRDPPANCDQPNDGIHEGRSSECTPDSADEPPQSEAEDPEVGNTPKRRRRGRPPRGPRSQGAPIPEKRGRGRPRKAIPVVRRVIERSASNEKREDEPPIRKRGRPRKS
ncbi:protein NYNRIN-like [Phymastichus coffea]|uniref:protein NYNRIN-like n=1 Tax=Phymastichus coffea TaxID=108790 RepID=UPI00273C23E7|nr:protein NYNRIN-like [Phymastichus coffea]